MNQYKQEYMTEFAYILGTMQQEHGNIIDTFPHVLNENQDGIKVFNEFVEFIVDKYLSTSYKDYEEFIKNNIDDLKVQFTNTEREDKWKNISNIALKYYYELEPVERIHLSDFEALHSINTVLDKPNLEIQGRLLEVIKQVWRKDEENIDVTKIADEICKAYKDKKITLDSLENANKRDLLQCVKEYDDFEYYNKLPIEINEYVNKLYNDLQNSEHINKNSNCFIDEGIVIGHKSDIINFLQTEIKDLIEESTDKECYETIIRNDKIMIEQLEEVNVEIIGIEYKSEYGMYELMDNEEIIEKFEELKENEQEEEDEEEYY